MENTASGIKTTTSWFHNFYIVFCHFDLKEERVLFQEQLWTRWSKRGNDCWCRHVEEWSWSLPSSFSSSSVSFISWETNTFFLEPCHREHQETTDLFTSWYKNPSLFHHLFPSHTSVDYMAKTLDSCALTFLLFQLMNSMYSYREVTWGQGLTERRRMALCSFYLQSHVTGIVSSLWVNKQILASGRSRKRAISNINAINTFLPGKKHQKNNLIQCFHSFNNPRVNVLYHDYKSVCQFEQLPPSTPSKSSDERNMFWLFSSDEISSFVISTCCTRNNLFLSRGFVLIFQQTC